MGKDLKGKELGVGLTQRKDGRYSAKYTANNGKRVERYFNKITEARRWLNEEIHNKNHSVYVDTKITLDKFYEFWIENCKNGIVRDNTLNNYKNQYIKHIKPQIGFMKMKDIKPMHCQHVLNVMFNDGYAYGTMTLTRITLHAIFKSAIENEYIIKNPVAESVKCKERESPQRRVLTLNEQKEFLKYASGTMYENAYRLVLQTGMRSGEIGGLKWEDIDYDNGFVHVKRTLLEDSKKGGFYFGLPKSKESVRDIPMSKECIQILKNQKRQQCKLKLKSRNWSDKWEGLIFTTQNGNPVGTSTFVNMMNKVVKRINEERIIEYNENHVKECERVVFERLYMHALRHTFATRCVEAGMNPKILQKILGHSTFSVTMDMYVHVMDEEKKKEIQKLQMLS